MRLIGIMCKAKNGTIGKGASLPWDIKTDGDGKFFKKTTMNGNLIIGSKTWDGMDNYQLPARNLFILTRQNKWGWMQLFSKDSQFSTNIVTNIDDLPDLTYFICGGKSVYEFLLPRISEFFVTTLNKDYDGDVVNSIDFEKAFKNKEVVEQHERYVVERHWN